MAPDASADRIATAQLRLSELELVEAEDTAKAEAGISDPTASPATLQPAFEGGILVSRARTLLLRPLQHPNSGDTYASGL
jgi:hypothetical protein